MTDSQSDGEHGRRSRHDSERPCETQPRRKRERVLILVQNLSVPFDRRVWLECQSLIDAGFRVAVVCPKAPGDPTYYPAQRSRSLQVPTVCSRWVERLLRPRIPLLVLRHPRPQPQGEHARSIRRRPELQSTGPLLAHRTPLSDASRILIRLRSPRSLSRALPIAVSRTATGSIYRALRLMERCTARTADHVISTNDSYRQIVLERDGVDPARVTVVRTGPDSDPAPSHRTPNRALRRDQPHLAAYLGVMGPQDGVDLVLEVADHVVHRLGRRDIGFTLIGSGDCFDDLVALSDRLDLSDFVTFTGTHPRRRRLARSSRRPTWASRRIRRTR